MSKSETIRAVIFKDSKMSNLDEIQKKLTIVKLQSKKRLILIKILKRLLSHFQILIKHYIIRGIRHSQ